MTRPQNVPRDFACQLTPPEQPHNHLPLGCPADQHLQHRPRRRGEAVGRTHTAHLILLEDLARAAEAYRQASHRNPGDDLLVWHQLQGHARLANLTGSAYDAMAALYAAQEQLSLLGDDPNLNDACGGVFAEDVEAALVRAGQFRSLT